MRFLTGRGWHFGQVNRISRLGLPADASVVRALHERAATAAGPEYRVHTWTDRTPDAWLDGVALLHTRMSTDAPSGDMAEPEDVWTADRVRESEEQLADGPHTMLTVAVEHVPSTTLAGFSQLKVPHDASRPVMQWDTLVLREHRGHRLGWLLKVVGIETVERDSPGGRRSSRSTPRRTGRCSTSTRRSGSSGWAARASGSSGTDGGSRVSGGRPTIGRS